LQFGIMPKVDSGAARGEFGVGQTASNARIEFNAVKQKEGEGRRMKRLDSLMGAIAICAIAFITGAASRAEQAAAPPYVTEMPAGYRDWRLISVAHEEGDLHSFAAVLGNEVAITAYRDGQRSFPDGTMTAALHYRHVPSAENNTVFGRDQSFVAGS